MNISIDVSPIRKNNLLQHKVRGSGFYIENLKNALLKYYPENNYFFFTQGERIQSASELIHYPYFEPFSLTLPFIKKTKTVVTVHDVIPLLFPEYFPSGIKGKIKWGIQKILLRQADAIITDSECSKKDICTFTGISKNKIFVVYLSASDEFKKLDIKNQAIYLKIMSLKKKYKLPDKFALYVGDVTWNKNIPRMIKAINQVDIPLVMVGKALKEFSFDKKNQWNRDRLKILELSKDNKNIFFLGFVPTEELVLLYNIATVFVMPSLYEGFGLPILEAMSCGCPVISAQQGSLPEIAQDAAYYVDAWDLQSITDGIMKMTQDMQLLQEFSEKGLNHSKKFSWRKTAGDTMNIYAHIIKAL